MDARRKRRDRLNLSGLTALGSNQTKQLSKSQTSLYRLSPLLTNEEASAQVLHHGHSVGDLNKTGLRSQTVCLTKERFLEEGSRKSSIPSADALKRILVHQNSFNIARDGIYSGSLPSLSSSDSTPKRTGHRYSRQRKSTKTQSLLTLMDYRENSLSDFAAKYCDLLPLQVQIQNGYHSPNNSARLQPGDTCSMYFIHQMEVVLGTVRGNTISLPLYTDIQFCFVHNPDHDLERATIGYDYQSVQDIIAANPRPKVVRSLTRWEDGHVTIDDDEILVVMGTILLTGDDTVWLEAYSLKVHTLLQLHSNCRALFTTRPQLLPLCLSDIMEYVPDPFPCTVQVYGYQSSSNGDLDIKTINIHCRVMESVIVCSSAASDNLLFALPVKNSVTVKLAHPSKNDGDDVVQQRKRARAILDNFSPSRCVYLADTRSNSVFDFQSALYKAIQGGKNNNGIYLPSNFSILSPRDQPSFKLLNNTPVPAEESTHTSEIGRESAEHLVGFDHLTINVVQDSFDTIEASSASSLSDGSVLSSSEPTPPTPPRPWRRCGSTQEEMIALQGQPSSSEESLYLSPLSLQAPGIFNLYSFAKRYSTQFPINADVKDGYVDLNGAQISRGDVLTVHGIAYTKAVSVIDEQGKVYVLPMDATSEFGVLQDKVFRNYYGDEAEFETIGDIVASDKIPTILCSRSQYNGGSQRNSVEANEILIVRKVKKITKVLKVYSVTMDTKKALAAKCEGHFTSAPRAVKLKIANLLQHFPNFLPGKAVAFPDTYCSELPAQLEYSIVTLASVHPANSLIFSCKSQEVANREGSNLLSVSLEHYLHLQPCEVQTPELAHNHFSMNHSKSVPLINVSSTFPRTCTSSFRKSPEIIREDNIRFLTTLNENQVLQLLDALHLNKYKRAFKDEKICGNLFCKFDEKILEEDLGVVSRLHRIKLMQIVNGETDARALLSNK